MKDQSKAEFWSKVEEVKQRASVRLGSMGCSPEQIEDSMSAATLKAWNARKSQSGDFSAWFVTIAVNIELDRRRSGSVALTAHLSENVLALQESACVEVPGYELEKELLPVKLVKAIRSLSNDQREIFLARALYGTKLQDFAYKHGLDLANVKTRNSRARQKLRMILSA